MESQLEEIGSNQNPQHIRWHPAPLGWLKLNVDGTVWSNYAAVGFVIRDSESHVLLAGAKNIGLAYDIHKCWRKVLVKGDPKLIVDYISQKTEPPWSLNF